MVLKGKTLTQTEIRLRPIAVQFGRQFKILTIHLNSLRAEVNGVAEIFLSVSLITFIIVNFCYR